MARNQIIVRWAACEKIPRGTSLLAMSAGEAGAEIDLFEAGIIGLTNVVRVALENAVSVASVLLLTEATMTELPEQRKDHAVEPDLVA